VEIMRVFIQAGYGSQELAALNHCRMYTRDIYLSNICNATGTQLKQNSWNNPTQGASKHIHMVRLSKTNPNGMERVATGLTAIIIIRP